MGEAEARGLARRIAARAQIRDVRLIKSAVELETVPRDDEQLAYGLKVSGGEVDWEPGQSLFAIMFAYTVDLSQLVIRENEEVDGPSEESHPIASIEFVMAALFDLQMRPGDTAVTEQELSAYAATTGSFALYPFVREYVYDLTGRLRLPPLTLPVQLIPVTEDEAVG